MNNATIAIDRLELLALKKLAIINGALAKTLTGQAAKEQLALTSVLVDVLHRADVATALGSRERAKSTP